MNHDVVPVSVCLFDDISITSYPIKSDYEAHDIYPALGNFYLASISNEKKKMIAACIFISSIKDSKSPELGAIAKKIFESHAPTKGSQKEAKTLLVSRLNINEINGTIAEAFSQKELDKIFTEFYMNYSTSGNA